MAQVLPTESTTEKDFLKTAALNFLKRNIKIAGRGDYHVFKN